MGWVIVGRCRHAGWIGFAFGLLGMVAGSNLGALAQTDSAAPTQQPGSGDPVLAHRPLPKPKSLLIPEGSIKLDVMVNDAAGKAVAGLEPWDFKILDNGQPRKVLSFRAFNDAEVKPDTPVEVLLVID